MNSNEKSDGLGGVISTAKDVTSGIAKGTQIGSAVPIVSPKVGAVLGGLWGLFGSSKK